jgi:hypothetical protein
MRFKNGARAVPARSSPEREVGAFAQEEPLRVGDHPQPGNRARSSQSSMTG